MARSRTAGRLIAIALSAASILNVAAQTQSSTPSQTASSPSSTITPATSAASAVGTASTSSDVPLSLWNIAESLLTSYYPSTTVSQVDTLTWPSEVVINSKTYTVHSGSTYPITTSVLAQETGTPASDGRHGDGGSSDGGHHGHPSDKKLGIIIGVVVGSVALAILALVFCCVHRRKKATGSYFMRRPTPSIAESDLEAWRSPRQREVSTFSSDPSHEWTEKYNQLPTGVPGASHMQPPPMAMHPAFARRYSHSNSNQSTSDENPFFTPQEGSEEHYEMDDGAAGASGAYKQLDAGGEAGGRRSSSSSTRRASRPSTPFSPAMMMMSSGAGGQPAQYQQPRGYQHNPFSSPEDDEMDDIVSPIVPARSPERRHSPMVHYPSWGEVSEFDFSGEGNGRGRHSLRNRSSGEEEGNEGWRPHRESVVGRQELA